MPYVIDRRQCAEPPNEQHGVRAKVLSTCAAVTLEKARDLISDEVGWFAGWVCSSSSKLPSGQDIHAQIDSLPEQGGTIGPLPDGTVIEVWPMVNEFGAPDVRGFLRGWHFPASMDDAEIIDAYNEEADSC